jgi:ABC-type antimicrobial peptide transport system ATPase subunit
MELRGKLLDVSGLKVSFYTYRGVIKALDGVELWMDSENVSVWSAKPAAESPSHRWR